MPTKRRDFFGGRLMTQVNKRVSAGSRKINVKPLPDFEKPDNFSGAVGDFKFNVITSKTELNASESLQARVEVTGKGNLKLFELPKLTLPNSLEVYEPEHNESIKTNLGGMRMDLFQIIIPLFLNIKVNILYRVFHFLILILKLKVIKQFRQVKL